MIEFKGMISSKAENFFWKKYSAESAMIFRLGGISVLCTSLVSFKALNNKAFLFGAVIALVAIIESFFIARINKSKERSKFLPYTISIDDKEISFKSAGYSETHLLEEVKTVCDYGEFYHVVFKNKGYVFICEKSLITRGTLEDFERMFGSKIKK